MAEPPVAIPGDPLVEPVSKGAWEDPPEAEDLPAWAQVPDQSKDGVGLDIEPVAFNEIDRCRWSHHTVTLENGGRSGILERTKVQRPGPIMSDQEVDRGIAQSADAVEDDEWVVHVDKNSNKLGEVVVISMVGLLNIHSSMGGPDAVARS